MVLAAALAGGVVVAGAAPAWASSPGIITTVAGGPGRGVARNVSQPPAAVAAAGDGTLWPGNGRGRHLHGRRGRPAGLRRRRRHGNATQLAAPGAVAVGPAGGMFIADTGNNRIRQVGG
jgi:hypothetical protein